MLLNWTMYPMRWYINEHEKDRYAPYCQIALLSLSLRPAEGKGSGAFLIEVR
ncbi:MAG: hypothetical protein ACRD2B_02255 [Terriglobia bacterium]